MLIVVVVDVELHQYWVLMDFSGVQYTLMVNGIGWRLIEVG